MAFTNNFIKNKTVNYLFPIIWKDRELANYMNNHFNIGGYFIGYQNLKKNEDSIYILVEYNNDFDEHIKNINLDYIEVNKNERLIKYKIGLDRIDHFISGEFSKIYSEEEVENIYGPFRGNPTMNYIYNVLTKSDILKKEIEDDLNVKIDTAAELADIPDIPNEVYMYNQNEQKNQQFLKEILWD